jgi:hypothetical protein
MRARGVALVAIILLVLAVCSPVFATDGVTVTWRSNGWDMTTILTNPGVQAGTEFTFNANATWYDSEGVAYKTEAEPLVVTVGVYTIKKEWVTVDPFPQWASIDAAATTGPGGCEILPDGKLRWWIEATNNGTPVTLTCRIRYRPPPGSAAAASSLTIQQIACARNTSTMNTPEQITLPIVE